MISGARAEIYGKDNLTQDTLTTVEELLEMSGAALFLYALTTCAVTSVRYWFVRAQPRGGRVADDISQRYATRTAPA
jgi:threonine aldolase